MFKITYDFEVYGVLLATTFIHDPPQFIRPCVKVASSTTPFKSSGPKGFQTSKLIPLKHLM